MLCPLSVPHCSKTKYSILFIWPLLLKMPGVDQIGTNYLSKIIIEDRFPILCGRCWATVFFAVDLRNLPTTHFFGKFFTWAGISGWSFRNRGQLHAVALYSAGKIINKLRTIGESYPLSLFCKHPRKFSIDLFFGMKKLERFFDFPAS